MTVEQFVMLLTSQSIVSTHAAANDTNAYRYAAAIHRIVCKDGISLSVQAHGNVHAKFEDAEQDFLHYSETFGRKLLCCETDCIDLDQYGINTIKEIESYVESHGGIDIEATISLGVDKAISLLENVNKSRH